MHIDVIMTMYNNAAVVPLALSALAAQVLPDGWRLRVIVSDDGSTDNSIELAQQLLQQHGLVGEVVTGKHGMSAAARNRGLGSSTSNIVLLSQADIILRPLAVAEHVLFHTDNPELTAAALGWVRWDPRVQPTPLMEWLVHGGPQNDYDALLGSTVADARHYFNGAHVSVKRALLGTNPFATDFAEYGWEDLDLGRRLADQGLILHVLSEAHALHHHFYSSTAVSWRQRAVGRGLHRYQQRYPKVTLVPQRQWWHRFLILALSYSGGGVLLRMVQSVCARYGAVPWVFIRTTSFDFWCGFYSIKNGY